jgi:hypothetical protein
MADPFGIEQIVPIIEAFGIMPTLTFLFVTVSIIVGSQAILSSIKNNGTKRMVESSLKNSENTILREFENLTEKINLIIEGQSFIMSSIEDITQAIVIINNKFGNFISEDNMIIILSTFIDGFLFSRIIEKIMIYVTRKKNGVTIEEIKKQLFLEMTNILDDFLYNVEQLKSSINVAKTIGAKFYKEISERIFKEIIEINFNDCITTAMKYDKTKAIFHSLSIRIINEIINEYHIS